MSVLAPKVPPWQQGCDDAKAGRYPRRPYPNARDIDFFECRANAAYMNGYRFGSRLRDQRVQEVADAA